MIERQKTETIVTKCYKDRKRISLSSRDERNYKSNTRDNTNPDQANGKYLLQLWVVVREKLYVSKKKIWNDW